MPFTRELSIGNRLLDTEHKRLLAATREIARLTDECNPEALQGMFKQLESSLVNYFAIKQDIARAVDFDFTRQQRAHQDLLDSTRQIGEKLASAGSSLSEREKIILAGLLKERLVHHFTVECKPLRIVLDTHYYDFSPATPVFA